MGPNVRIVDSKHALAVYAESLTAAGRVAVFGDASLGLGARLAELGARSVDVWDPDGIRARKEADRAPHGVSIAAYPSAESPPFGAVDLVIVPDLGAFDAPDELLSRVRAMLGSDGVAVVSAANGGNGPHRESRAFDYYELFDLVAAEFEEVRMVAELPFRGVALVRLGDEDEPQSVSVDAQLADAERAADSFVVVASQTPLPFDPYTIIELPGEPDSARANDAEAARAAQESLAQKQDLERQVEALQAELRSRADIIESASERAASLESSLHEQSTRVAELEAALVERARHLSDLSTDIEEMLAAAEAGRVALVEIEPMARRVELVERRNEDLQRELAGVGEAHAGELARFEEGLRERAHAVQSLEAELKRREAMVRELISAVEESSSSPAPVVTHVPMDSHEKRALSDENRKLREQLDKLALDVARREGEAQATAWTVAELERQLSQAVAPVDAPALGLREALDEVDALRRALTQEHEARHRAESAEKKARDAVE